MKKNALYRFYGDTGQLLYVGITSDPARRFGQHASTKAWWPSVRGITLDWYSSRREVEAAEKRAIEVERPLMNLQRPSMTPVPDENRRCGHCIACVRNEPPCHIYGLDLDDDFHPGPCRCCDDPHCLFEIGMEYGDQRGWSRAYAWHKERYGGA